MDLRLLETFTAVVDCRTLSAAASELGYAQPTITLHIQQLEKQLQIELFERDGKRLRVSEAGRALYEDAQMLLRRFSETKNRMRAFSEGCAGTLRLGCVEPFISARLPKLLKTFASGTSALRISVEAGASEPLYRRLRNGDFDFVIAATPLERYADVRFEPMYTERLALLLPDWHQLTHKKDLRFEDALEDVLLLPGRACEYRLALQHALSLESLDAAKQITITTLEARKAAVQQGLGIALLPHSAARPAPTGTVLRTPVEDIMIRIGLAYRDDLGMTPAMRRFHALFSENSALAKRCGAA
jgi:DNA-binding transcriptional LysR family regulator